MRKSVSVLGITLGLGIFAFVAGPLIWPSPVGASTPYSVYGGLAPFFIAVALAEDLLFGAGVAFVIFGLPLVRSAASSPVMTWAAYLSIAWALVSWWPHDNFHRMTAGNLGVPLLLIEYGFHITLMLTALVIAWFFLSVLRTSGGPPSSL